MINLPSLPLEIQGMIVDELGAMLAVRDHRKFAYSALLLCHLTSRFLRLRALRYLYENTDISNADITSSRGNFSKRISILKEIVLSPESSLGSVGPFIKSLVITFERKQELEKLHDSLWVKSIASDITEFLGHEDITPILQGLCKPECGVKEFILKLDIKAGGGFHFLDYHQLPLNFCAVFISFARSRHMRSIQVHYEEPVRFLVAKRDLHVNGAAEGAGDYSINACTDYGFPYCDMLPKSYYHNLNDFVAFNTGAQHAARTWELVEIASENLRKLSIFQYGPMTLPPRHLNLNILSELTSFTFRHASSSSYHTTPDIQTFQMLHQLFCVSSPMNFLNNVELRFRFDHKQEMRGFFEQLDWDILDQRLSGPCFPALRRFRIKLQVDFSYYCDVLVFTEDTTQVLKNRFWRVLQSPTIRLIVDVHPEIIS
ncbi:hypothetical protein BDN70DRAFT_878619 [Pholiota conissans]|uniref:Uncharacterized protein n=1 Tax=Pholiota conissans TaxID=109636 RepID=A0A9P6D0P0_9AGAR|nr:hypothetical protein BDN70DRAFT_878619 [Pholiota conissans]